MKRTASGLTVSTLTMVALGTVGILLLAGPVPVVFLVGVLGGLPPRRAACLAVGVAVAVTLWMGRKLGGSK